MINSNATIFRSKKNLLTLSSAARSRSITEESLVAAKVLYGGYFNTYINVHLITFAQRVTAYDTNHL